MQNLNFIKSLKRIRFPNVGYSSHEGLQIGSGNIKNFSNINNKIVMKIIQVWQAQHNNGHGFIEALNILYRHSYKK